MSLNNLANGLFAYFQQLGRLEDLEKVIVHHCEALSLRPARHPDRSVSLFNLAAAFVTRFHQLRRMEDLEEGIVHYREALSLRPSGHPKRPKTLSNLANALTTRFSQLGRMEDLEEVILHHHDTLSLHPFGHSDRPSSLISYGNSLLLRFDRLRRMEDLEVAIKHYSEALSLHPLGHAHRSMSLNNLANALFSRFRLLGTVEDLEVVIVHHREALSLRFSGHPNRSMSLNNLANALVARFEQSERMQDIEEAIAHYRNALSLLPSGHLEPSLCLSLLSDALLARYAHHHDINDLEEMFTLLEASVNHRSSSGVSRLQTALKWATLAHLYQHRTTIHAYSQSFILLNYCITMFPGIESRQNFLADIVSKLPASDAAAYAISVDQLETAIELLEQGRTLLWSKMFSYRHPLADLREVDCSLATQFETLSTQLEQLALSFSSQTNAEESSVMVDNMIKTQRRLTEEWEEVVEKIRKLGGTLANFLRASPFTALQTAAVEGPIIIVNISIYRSDAIILQSSGPPILVPLPEASPQYLTSLTAELLDAKCSHSAPHLVEVLQKLWNTIVSPVRDQLVVLQVAKGTRVWWCPTSTASGLPLHAARLVPAAPGPKIFSDIYVSSYTPTLSALIRARSGVASSSTIPKVLVMGQPGDNSETGALCYVREEMHRIHSFGDFVNVLADSQANRFNVLSHLHDHNWIHFACHGYQSDQPFDSYFQLYNGEHLKVIDLAQAKLPNAEFAFLSACHTAADSEGTPDEVVHLAAAMQFCGFRSVVGTLWSISDAAGPDIAEEFYKYMFRNPDKADFSDAATALNITARKLRRKISPFDWVCLIHIGA
jgi:tetratricopeptide (TPR) repeat protein